MIKKVTIGEMEKDLDDMLDQLQANPDLVFQILGDSGEPAARLISIQLAEKEEAELEEYLSAIKDVREGLAQLGKEFSKLS